MGRIRQRRTVCASTMIADWESVAQGQMSHGDVEKRMNLGTQLSLVSLSQPKGALHPSVPGFLLECTPSGETMKLSVLCFLGRTSPDPLAPHMVRQFRT